VFEALVTITEQALEASTLIYDVLGSSALDRSSLLDRHWRNARTLTSHNPRAYKARIAGGWHLNGSDPVVALLGKVAE
jgi:alkylation response protein AidB-like acyl-CoA dehydrogenase